MSENPVADNERMERYLAEIHGPLPIRGPKGCCSDSGGYCCPECGHKQGGKVGACGCEDCTTCRERRTKLAERWRDRPAPTNPVAFYAAVALISIGGAVVLAALFVVPWRLLG